jgi:metallo-beta-lactamase class B
VAPRTYYISGQKWVGAYLIDTDSDLILIDTGIEESAYLLVDSIYQLGYKPSQIKKILLSHAHVDHCGAAALMKELSGAELYMSREDYEFMQKAPEETIALDSRMPGWSFYPDQFYSDNTPIVLGAMSVRTLLTLGHTIGCTSFFWDVVTPYNGVLYSGMVG